MAPHCTVSDFGRLPDGREVQAVTLCAGPLRATILTWGATLQAMHTPDRNGQCADVTAGFAHLDDYLAHSPYFGASIGRVANRIAGGCFVVDSTAYHIPCNNGPNALHGGPEGFDRRLWTLMAHGVDIPMASAFAVLTLISDHADQGFPGRLEVTSEWRLYPDRLCVTYTATTDRPTVVNMTNHAYWNLAGDGAGDAMDHELLIPAAHFLPVDAGAIPTGERRAVDGTLFDFRTPTRIGARLASRDDQLLVGGGYDHNWCLRDGLMPEPVLACVLTDPHSGRTMAVWSDHPGLQFYSGNFLDGSFSGKTGRPYAHRSAIALEPQHFPDAVNQPDFGSLRLDPGQSYRHTIAWHFSA
jgi:aldose 1-epimerase